MFFQREMKWNDQNSETLRIFKFKQLKSDRNHKKGSKKTL